MAEKSLFFNALPDTSQPTGYDRNYNADDISDWLDVIMTTGVIKSETGLKVTAAGGMNVSVNVGKAVINGKPYRNDSAKAFTIDTAPTGSTPRLDLIVLRFDRSTAVRDTRLLYRKGTDAAEPALIRTDLIYELAIARITVAPSVTTIAQTAIQDLRGDRETAINTTTGRGLGYCPYLTAAKGYEDYYDAIVLEFSDEITLNTQSATVTFDIPQYGWTGVDIVNVYTNGLRERGSNYTITGSTITFKAAKAAGSLIEVVVHKFIDGEGLGTALQQYQDLQAQVLKFTAADKYKYMCNGVNDNIVLSQIAQAFHAGTYTAAEISQAAVAFLEKWGGVAGLAALTADAAVKIEVFGKFGASAPYSGTGTAVNPYQWLALGRATSNAKNIIFDFTNVENMYFPCINASYNVIFGGKDAHVIGAHVIAENTAVNTNIRAFDATAARIICENSSFNITSYSSGYISTVGTFTNCRGIVANMTANSYAFFPTSGGLLRIVGGEYCAYTGDSSAQCAVVGQSEAEAATILYGVSVPTVARSGFYQKSSVVQFAGGGVLNCTDLVSALPLTVVSGISNIRGTIAKSKPNSI